jgi:hypothetical protein
VCDRADAGLGAGELLLGHLDASCHYVIHWTGSGARPEPSREMEPADTCRSRHRLQTDGATQMAVQVALQGGPGPVTQRSNTAPSARGLDGGWPVARWRPMEASCRGRCCLRDGEHGGNRGFDAVMVFLG